jgi:hypothetical protein
MFLDIYITNNPRFIGPFEGPIIDFQPGIQPRRRNHRMYFHPSLTTWNLPHGIVEQSCFYKQGSTLLLYREPLRHFSVDNTPASLLCPTIIIFPPNLRLPRGYADKLKEISSLREAESFGNDSSSPRITII